MLIAESYKYIQGKKFTGELTKEPVRCTPEMVNKFIEGVRQSVYGSINLKTISNPKEFYRCEPDIERLFETKEEREEVFYAMKCEKYSPVIPSKFLFLILKCKEQFKSINYLPKVLSAGDVNKLFSKGTIADGLTLEEVIKSLVDSQYQVLSPFKRVVQVHGYWEVLLEEDDAIIFIPDGLKSKLSERDYDNIKIGPKDLLLNNKPLRYFGGYFGACNSKLDLTGLI